jgi:pimeloyl-ACP methyl ester carboxylesterase
MKSSVRNLLDLHRLHAFDKVNPLILINGLAEQSVSWFANRRTWARHFDVKVPEILLYDSPSLHRHIDAGGEVTIDYLTERLANYLEEYVQRPPYNLVGSSLGGQVIATYAVRYPKLVSKLVFLCPSGFHGDENLPMMEGVRRSQYDTLVQSVFHKNQFASDELINVIAKKFQDRTWKKGVLRTLRGTVGHSVSDILDKIPHQSLVIWGTDDNVISDVNGSIRAAERILKVNQVVIPKCGHAPQIEKSHLVNQLVTRFLKGNLKTIPPQLDHTRYLAQQDKPKRPSIVSAVMRP